MVLIDVQGERSSRRLENRPAMPSFRMCYSRYLLKGETTRSTCFAEQCPIDCIQKNNYDEAKCKKQVGIVLKHQHCWTSANDTYQIDALYECCNLFYEKEGDDASTVSCPKANLLRFALT
jgi:hypothetical protein